MRQILAQINFAIRRIACKLFGHIKADVSLDTVGLQICRRCLRITDQKTIRARLNLTSTDDTLTVNQRATVAEQIDNYEQIPATSPRHAHEGATLILRTMYTVGETTR